MTKKWDEFEEENDASEDTRLRADSDVTREPESVEETKQRNSGWPQTFGQDRRKYQLVSRGSQAVNGEQGDSEASMLRSLRFAMISIFGLGFGLMIGAIVFGGKQSLKGNGGENTLQQQQQQQQLRGSTLGPTVANTPNLQPTITQSIDEDAPVLFMDDPRFGNEYKIDKDREDRWHEQYDLKNGMKKYIFDNFKDNGTQNEAFQKLVCEEKPNPPTKYVFPPKEYAPSSRKWPLERKLRHIRQFKYAISEYYHFMDVNSASFYAPVGAEENREKLLNRLANFFLKRLEAKGKPEPQIKVGTMGSSVMSGQDNCHYYTYPMQLQRNLEHLLAPWHVGVSIFNMGQNGDGPNMEAQMICAPFTMPEIDFLHFWYPMIPHAELILKQNFAYRMIRDKGVSHIHFLDDTNKIPVESINQAGYTSINTKLRSNIDWAYKHFWGRRNDGLCHNVTREGAIAVNMQNWHLGPISFQVLVDQVVFLYADAIELALISLIESKPLAKPLTLDDITVEPLEQSCNAIKNSDPKAVPLALSQYFCEAGGFDKLEYYCAVGYQPQFAKGFDLGADLMQPSQTSKKNTFPKYDGDSTVAKWSYSNIKKPSGIAGANEQKESNYRSRPECSLFEDNGFAIVAQAIVESEWLTFSFPKEAAVALKDVRHIHVYICHAQRDEVFSALQDCTVLFGVNGKVWGEGHIGASQSCFRANQPNAIKLPDQGDVLGIRVIGKDPSKKIKLTIGQVIFVPQPLTETSVPSSQALIPSNQPTVKSETHESGSPTQGVDEPTEVPHPSDLEEDEPTQVPHPSDDFEDEPTQVPHPSDDFEDEPTEVPHPSDDFEDEPTEVPHPSDDQFAKRRRLRIKRVRKDRTFVVHRS